MPRVTLEGSVNRALRAGAALVVAGLLAISPALAQEPEVVARVGETEITSGDVDMALEMFAEQLAQVPEEQRRTMVVDALVDMHLLADAAREEGLGETEEFQKRVDFLTKQALRTAYIEKNVQNAITDEELKARYEQDIAGFTPAEEVHAAHILVETEEEAKQIIADLAAGGDFAAIAKEKSQDPGSGANGGDLGFFGKGQMVPEFETAAFSLPVGEVTKEPVKTQFGFHVLKVLEKRTQPVPPFEEVREQIMPVVQRDKFQQVLTDLRAATTVERFDQPAADAATDEAPDGDAADAEEEEAPAEGEAAPAQ